MSKYFMVSKSTLRDLAEKYTADKEYEPGTVLVFVMKKKLQNGQYQDPKISRVVPTEPAHLMNDGIEGVAIALKGRVPCKVEGPVKKGDILVTGPIAGTATALRPDSATPSAWCVVGKSLENSDEAGIRLVEVAV